MWNVKIVIEACVSIVGGPLQALDMVELQTMLN